MRSSGGMRIGGRLGSGVSSTRRSRKEGSKRRRADRGVMVHFFLGVAQGMGWVREVDDGDSEGTRLQGNETREWI